MRKGWMFSGLAALAVASALWAKPGLVRLNDGTEIAGDVDESDPQKIIVTLHGVQELLPRDQIKSIEYPANLDDQFEDRLDKLQPQDTAGRMDLARWAEEHRRFDLARRAAAEVLAINPADSQAIELIRDISFQAALTSTTLPSLAAAAPAARPVAVEYPKHYLSLGQVNEIRQIELKPDDFFRVTFEHDVRQRFLNLGGIDAATFYSLAPADQARQILANGDAGMAGDVRIQTEPSAMAEFHMRIQGLVLGGCAVSGCHDDVTAAGGFGLFKHDESPPAWYTNFYMLQTYSRTPAPGADRKLMIDRVHPEYSLLVNYAMPPALAMTPHPAARNFHPAISGRNDPHYQSFLHWIGVMLKPQGGAYRDIAYTPPWAEAKPVAAQAKPVAAEAKPAVTEPTR